MITIPEIEEKMKKSIKEIRNELASMGNTVDQMEKRISVIKCKNIENMQKEEKLEHLKYERAL